MLIHELRTNVKGLPTTVRFEPCSGVTGPVRSGKSRLKQSIELVMNGALPRLGRKSDIIELVPASEFPEGTMYARARYKELEVASYVAEVRGGKVTDVNHEMVSERYKGCLPTSEWSDLIDLGDAKGLQEMFRAFGQGIDVQTMRGLTEEQEEALSEMIGEEELDVPTLLRKLDSKTRGLTTVINTKTAELEAIVAAESEAGANDVTCPECSHVFGVEMPGTASIRLALRKAELEKETYKGLQSEVKRLASNQIKESKDSIVKLAQSFMPLGLTVDLDISKSRCRWLVKGKDGRFHGAKVACGTERAALSYAIIRTWASVRKSKGLPVLLLLDDPDFTGLTLADRAEMLRKVEDAVKAGEIDQAIVFSADAIFPEGWKVNNVQ